MPAILKAFLERGAQGGMQCAEPLPPELPSNAPLLSEESENEDTEDSRHPRALGKRKRMDQKEEESESDYSAAEIPERKKKGFVCMHPGCGRIFNSSSKPGQHRRTHTGEVSFRIGFLPLSCLLCARNGCI